MIPLGDVVPRRTEPIVTLTVVGILSVVLLALHALADAEARGALLWSWGAGPDTMPWPAVVTACWLEPSWVAGAANAAAVFWLGPALEDRLGHARFTVLLASAVAVTLVMSMALPTAVPTAGAAGPAVAVIAAYLVLFPSSKLVFWIPGPRGGSLHAVHVMWSVAVWVMLVPGTLVRDGRTGIPAHPPWPVMGAAALWGALGARFLVQRERLQVSWWDEAV